MSEGVAYQVDVLHQDGGRRSAKLDITSSYLQGSSLEPLFFLVFISVIASALKSPIFIFIDDVKVVGSTGRGDHSSDMG